VSILFMADNDLEDAGAHEGSYGTGRSTLFSIAHQLYGERYTTQQSFRVIEGSSGQADYSDWMAYAVLATVDESKASPTAHRRGERMATYEAFKNISEPGPMRRLFTKKKQQAFLAMCHCSIWMATNHVNCMAIPANCRRLAVLRNGKPMTRAQARRIHAWRQDPANIAALARYLEAMSYTP